MQSATDDLPKDGHRSASMFKIPYNFVETYMAVRPLARRHIWGDETYLEILLRPSFLSQESDEHFGV